MFLANFLLLSIAIALFFLYLKQPWISAIILIGFAVYSFFSISSKTIRATKKTAKAVFGGIGEEVKQAQSPYPPAGAWKDMIKEAGTRAGEASAPDDYRLTMRKPGEKIGKATKKIIEAFKKMFEG